MMDGGDRWRLVPGFVFFFSFNAAGAAVTLEAHRLTGTYRRSSLSLFVLCVFFFFFNHRGFHYCNGYLKDAGCISTDSATV